MKQKKASFSRIHFSSKSVKWNTPQEIFKELDEEFHFNFDPCIPSLTGFKGNGLKEKWATSHSKGRVFCNMPYDDQERWIKYGWMQLCEDYAELIVFLIPFRANSGVKFLNKRGAEFRYAEERLHFNEDPEPAPFDSMICIVTRQNVLDYWKKIGIT